MFVFRVCKAGGFLSNVSRPPTHLHKLYWSFPNKLVSSSCIVKILVLCLRNMEINNGPLKLHCKTRVNFTQTQVDQNFVFSENLQRTIAGKLHVPNGSCMRGICVQSEGTASKLNKGRTSCPSSNKNIICNLFLVSCASTRLPPSEYSIRLRKGKPFIRM